MVENEVEIEYEHFQGFINYAHLRQSFAGTVYAEIIEAMKVC